MLLPGEQRLPPILLCPVITSCTSVEDTNTSSETKEAQFS